MAKQKKQQTITEILAGADIAELMSELRSGGFEPTKLVIIGVGEDGGLRLSHSCVSLAEVIGLLVLATDRVSGGVE